MTQSIDSLKVQVANVTQQMGSMKSSMRDEIGSLKVDFTKNSVQQAVLNNTTNEMIGELDDKVTLLDLDVIRLNQKVTDMKDDLTQFKYEVRVFTYMATGSLNYIEARLRPLANTSQNVTYP